MRCLLLLAICFLYSTVRGASDEPKFERYLEFKCNQSGENTLHDLERSLGDFQRTVTELLPERVNYYEIFEGFENLCTSDARKIIYGSFLKVIEKLEPCLAKQEQYMKTSLPQIFNYTMDQFCQGDDFVTLKEIYVMVFSSPNCFAGLNNFGENCVEKMTLYNNMRAEKYFWGKKDFCRDVDFLKRCVKTIKPCKFIYEEGIRILTKSSSKWCNLY